MGEDVDLSVKVTAQYLPTPAAIIWQNMAGDKVGLTNFLLLNINGLKSEVYTRGLTIHYWLCIGIGNFANYHL